MISSMGSLFQTAVSVNNLSLIPSQPLWAVPFPQALCKLWEAMSVFTSLYILIMERRKLGEVEESFVLLVLNMLFFSLNFPPLINFPPLTKEAMLIMCRGMQSLACLLCFFLGWGSASESLLTTIAAGTQPLADADSCIYTKPSPPAAARIFSPAHISSQHVELISELL